MNQSRSPVDGLQSPINVCRSDIRYFIFGNSFIIIHDSTMNLNQPLNRLKWFLVVLHQSVDLIGCHWAHLKLQLWQFSHCWSIIIFPLIPIKWFLFHLICVSFDLMWTTFFNVNAPQHSVLQSKNHRNSLNINRFLHSHEINNH